MPLIAPLMAPGASYAALESHPGGWVVLVIVSDVHLTDRIEGSAVSNEELLGWLTSVQAHLSALREPPSKLNIVLNGDIIDVIRSREWDEQTFAPWQDLSPRFSGFADTSSHDCVVNAVTATCARYAPFFEALRALQASGAQVTYIAGNHDFMLQLSSAARAVLNTNLYGDPRDPDRPLPTHLHLPEYSAWLEHGHRCDPYNFHDVDSSTWAFGDAVVMEFLNRLPGRVMKARPNLTRQSRLIKQLGELDNVEPSYMIPAFISELLQDTLAHDKDRSSIQQLVIEATSGLLSIPEFQSAKLGIYKTVLESVVTWSVAEVLAKAADVFKSERDAVHRRAEELLDTDAPTVRYIIMGHNHRAGVVALDHIGDHGVVYYLNTGTWRRVFRRIDRAPARFFSMRTLSWIELWRPSSGDVVHFRHVHERTG